MDQTPYREVSLARSLKSSGNTWSGRGTCRGGRWSPPLHLGPLTLALLGGRHRLCLPTIFKKHSGGCETLKESWFLTPFQLAVHPSVLAWPMLLPSTWLLVLSPCPPQKLGPKLVLASRSVSSLQQYSPGQPCHHCPSTTATPSHQPHQLQVIK